MNTEMNDKLDVLIALSAKDCGNDDVEMFHGLDTSKTVLGRGFYIKQRRIINKHKHKPTVILLKKCFIRVAIALLLLMSIGFLTVMAVPELREAVFEVVIEWHDDYIAIHFEPSDRDQHESTDPSSVSEVISESESLYTEIPPPTEIETVMKPTYIPEGVEEDIVLNTMASVVIDYYLEDDLVLSYIQTLFSDKDKLFDNNTNITYNVEINGNSAVVLEYEVSGQAIIWTDGAYYYYVHSMTMDLNELIKVASSVQ